MASKLIVFNLSSMIFIHFYFLVISGLQNHCVFRLKGTWDILPDKAWDKWEELKEIFKCDQNFLALRGVSSNCPLPSVPYLGMFVYFSY